MQQGKSIVALPEALACKTATQHALQLLVETEESPQASKAATIACLFFLLNLHAPATYIAHNPDYWIVYVYKNDHFNKKFYL